MMKVAIWLLIGGGIGAAMGYFGQCTSGTCPLTANWKRGAIVGAAMGLLLFFGSGGTASSEVTKSSTNVQAIQEADFDAQVLKADKPVVVDFFASWCGPCQRLSPMLDKVAGKFTSQVKVVKVNVDNAPQLAKKYDISGIPALKFFSGGREVGGTVGLPTEQQLEQHFKSLAEKKPQG